MTADLFLWCVGPSSLPTIRCSPPPSAEQTKPPSHCLPAPLPTRPLYPPPYPPHPPSVSHTTHNTTQGDKPPVGPDDDEHEGGGHPDKKGKGGGKRPAYHNHADVGSSRQRVVA